MNPDVLEKDAAKEAARRAAFLITDETASDYGRSIIHVFLDSSFAFIGADWELGQVLDLIEGAEQVAWIYGPAGHNLAVLSEGRVFALDVRRPA
jgi:hypothetical protein